MKRILAVIAAFVICLSLASCTRKNSVSDSAVTFYYKSVDFQYGSPLGVLASEARNFSEYQSNYEQIIELYLKGPKEHNHISPFPAGIYLKEFTLGADRAYITLSSHISMLSGLDLTIACACLTKTVLGITGVSSIEITADNSTLDGQAYLIYTNNDFVFLDNYADTLN